jgi:acyl-CoA synthetase (AMP-forming)/AMP-acid ligase II
MRIWRGYHGTELRDLLRGSWDDERLLILCPPGLGDESFLPALRIQSQWPEPPVLGVFTSGTASSRPRLVLYSRRGVLAALEGVYSLFDRARITDVFCYPQAFHTFGLTLGYLAAHVHGWRLHTPSGKYQREAHRARLDRTEPGLLTLGTPTHFHDLLSESRRLGLKPAPSYASVAGGACVSRALWLRMRDELRIEAPSIGYGCTEASPGITHLPPGTVPEADNEIGRPLTSLNAAIHDMAVEISGASLCLAIVENGRLEFPRALRINDRLQVDERGIWRYLGRSDWLINRGGSKFSLEEIERVISQRLGVATLACGVRDVRLGEDLGLAFLRSGDSENLIKRTDAVLRESFGFGLSPERARFVAEFPMNDAAKPDRKSLWTLFEEAGTIAP